jgi:hypothetical protein
MAGTRAPFASLAALAAVASVHGEQTRSDATEAAKRDLQSLPVVQRPSETTGGKSLFSGTSSVTGLSIGSPNGSAGPAKNRDDAAPGRSVNWLLDGVNQLEAEAKSQRVTEEGGNAGDSREAATKDDRAVTGTPNPFAGYLTQWLSPGDQALLNDASRNASTSSTAPWEKARSEFARETTPAAAASGTVNPFQMELPGLDAGDPDRQRQNPYLADPSPSEFPVAASLVSASKDKETPGALPSILTPSQSLLPVAPIAAPIEQARPAPVAAPTERLIDDRKYFPQLRRF